MMTTTSFEAETSSIDRINEALLKDVQINLATSNHGHQQYDHLVISWNF